MGPPSLTMTTPIEPGNRQSPIVIHYPPAPDRRRPGGGGHVGREEVCPRRAGRQRPRRRPARARPDHAHDVVVGVADAPHHRRRAAGLGERGGKGDERPRQVPDAAEAPLGAAGDLRRRAGRSRRPFVRHRELHAGAAHPADDRGAPRRGRDLVRQLGRLLAGLLEALPQSRRVQRREAAGGVHARPWPAVYQAAGQQHQRYPGPQDPHRGRRGRGGGQGARRLGVREAGARVLRAAEIGRRRRRVLPDGVDHLVQARDRARAGDTVPGRDVQLGVRLLHERGQVEQAPEAGPGGDREDLRRVDRATRRAVLGRRRPEGLRRAQEVGRQDRQRRRRPRGGGEEAVGADHRRLDPEGQRQGRGRRQDPRRVPRGAEEGRRRPVSAPPRGWERRVEAVLGVAASAILLAMMLLTFVDVVARYVFSRPVRGAFEVTELMLLVLIFAGLPLVSYADEHALMDFIDRLLGARLQRRLERAVQALCAAVMGLLAWLVWLKADRIWAYRDATDVLRIVYGPFVYFMAVMIGLAGLILLYKAVERR